MMVNSQNKTGLQILARTLNLSCIMFMFIFCFTNVLRAQKKPNILLIISDDLNTRIGPYMEIDKHTPNLDRLSNEGIRFSRSYSQYPLCGPSRASFMSGLYPETTKVFNNVNKPGASKKNNPSLVNHPSMAGFFREHGYFTARVSKIYHIGVPGGIMRGESGGDDPESWDYAYNVMGPETLSSGNLELLSPGNNHYGANFSRMLLNNELESTQTDYLATSQAIAILENRTGKPPKNGTNFKKEKADSPFFLAVGLVRPHVPFIAPKNCFEPYSENEVQLPPVVVGSNVPEQALRKKNDNIWKMSDTQKQQTISVYMASVRFMDKQVGRLLDALDRLKIREETIVVFVSDHGYNLGEHDCWSKISLWEGSIRVPLIISAPESDENNGATCETITELIDLYPTLTELCGFSNEQPHILQGKSLVKYTKEPSSINSTSLAYSISYGGRAASIRSQRWRYTRWGENVENENEELYDHLKDPEEGINLADEPEMKMILIELRHKFELVRIKARSKT